MWRVGLDCVEDPFGVHVYFPSFGKKKFVGSLCILRDRKLFKSALAAAVFSRKGLLILESMRLVFFKTILDVYLG